MKILHIFPIHNEVIKTVFNFFEYLSDRYPKYSHEVLISSKANQLLYDKEKDMHQDLLINEFPETNILKTNALICKKIKAADAVFFHYLPYPKWMVLSFLIPGIAQKTCWVLWGGDVYKKKKKLDLQKLISIVLYKVFFTKIGFIGSSQIEEFNNVSSMHNLEKKYLKLSYSLEDYTFLDELKDQKQTKSITILAGNSACDSNNHLELFNELDQAISEIPEPVNIICPLSYSNNDQDYISKVIEAGKQRFGENFVPLTEYMDRLDYYKILSNIDVAVMFHQRNRGLGLVRTLMYLGKVIYLRNDNVNYTHFNKMGSTIEDSLSINIHGLKTRLTGAEKEQNRNYLKQHFSREASTEQWVTAFEEMK